MLNRKRTWNVVGTSNAEVLGSSKCVLLVIQEIARVFPTKFIYIPFEVLPWNDQIHEIPGFEAVTTGSGKNVKWPPSAFQKQLARWPCLGYGESVAQTEAANPRLGRWLWSACTALERTTQEICLKYSNCITKLETSFDACQLPWLSNRR